MHEVDLVLIPMDLKIWLIKRSDNHEACGNTLYQSIVGSIINTMTGTRPNISYAVRVLS